MQRLSIAVFVVALAALPLVAEAQGRGRPKGPRETAAGDTGGAQGGGATGGSLVAPTFRQFGVWLDDASALAAREGRFGIGAGYWRGGGASLADVPIVDVAYGASDRVMLAASVPFYQSTYQGTTSRGLDDVYLSGKFVAVDPARTGSGVGLAVTPVVEILSAGYTSDRLHWALPVSVELRRSPIRLYGSTGYFSRGAVFGAGAVEVATGAGTVVTGALTHAASTDDTDLPGAGGRTDASVGVSHSLADAVAAWLSVGRTLSSADANGTTFGISGGLSFSFSPAAGQP